MTKESITATATEQVTLESTMASPCNPKYNNSEVTTILYYSMKLKGLVASLSETEVP